MKKIADEVGMHESTISRTVNNKYIQTPRGTFELRFFLSASIETGDGTNIAANGIKDLMKKMISEEEKGDPLSDLQLTKILQGKDIKIARRTVAKYRDELSILSAKKRML